MKTQKEAKIATVRAAVLAVFGLIYKDLAEEVKERQRRGEGAIQGVMSREPQPA